MIILKKFKKKLRIIKKGQKVKREEFLIPITNFDTIDKILIEFHPNVIGNKSVSNIIKILIDKGFCLDLFKSV